MNKLTLSLLLVIGFAGFSAVAMNSDQRTEAQKIDEWLKEINEFNSSQLCVISSKSPALMTDQEIKNELNDLYQKRCNLSYGANPHPLQARINKLEAAKQAAAQKALANASMYSTSQKSAPKNAKKSKSHVEAHNAGLGSNLPAQEAAKASVKDQEVRLEAHEAAKEQEARVGQVERRHSFVEKLRKSKASIAAAGVAGTAAVAGAITALSSPINCAEVAQAVCNNQVVSQAALEVCKEYIPNALSCWLGNF